MGKKSDESTSFFSKTWVRVVIILLVLLGTGWYAWGVYAKYNRGLNTGPDEQAMRGPGPDGEGPRRPPSPEQMRVRMNEMMNELKMTDDQKRQMQALMSQGWPKSREEGEARRAEMDKILTPEQQQQMRQSMQNRMAQRMERMKRTMSPQDFAAFEKRMTERMARGGGRGGRGGPGGPPPGPPPQ